ncbi:MAG: hypothetical protein CMA27_05670 [Euryarchaeota archaeon]|nr:hypothetical protein [Euryarchaeota archaeon]|tara:strand:+ start:472 stop:1704 length:1233 start_codon:yes stop_codon:yes gene_type:complete
MATPSFSNNKNYFVSLEEALKLSKTIKIPTFEEKLPIENTLHRVLINDIYSKINDPPFNNSSMDGYAVIYSDTITATENEPIELEIIGTLPAGETPNEKLTSGFAIKIMTGAPIPDGADSIIMVEKTKKTNNKVLLYSPSFPNYIRIKGENLSKNELIFKKGTYLTPREIGLLATMGFSEVSVIKQLKISIISTGDELIAPGKELLPGQIYESNSYVLEGLIKEMGHIPIRHNSVSDTIDDLREELDKASNISDLIITSGGVSMGDFDLVRKIMEEEGNILFWRIKIKPGSPPLFGKWNNTPIFGLPGNPVSSHVVFQILINPWLKFITNANGPTPKIVKAKLLENINLKKEYINFSRVIVENTGTEMIAYTTTHQGSGNLHSLTTSNALTILPYNEKGTKDQIIDVLLL